MSNKKGLAVLDRGTTEKRPNQWTGNPKQLLFCAFYLDPKLPDTFGNAYQSALQAGYSDNYAKQITAPSISNKWITEYKRIALLQPEHITAGITDIALNAAKASDRLRAYELLAKLQGLLVDRQISATVNIEQALNSLK
jgi:hypothetical protein